MKNIFLALVGALASFTSCNNQYVTTVDADQFEQMMKSQKIQIIDARTAEEYAEGFIPTAVNIDVNKSDFKAKAESFLSKDKPVGIYCRSGRRSLKGAQILSESKYKIINLRGGILEWTGKGKTIEKR